MFAAPTQYFGKAVQSSLERQFIADYLAVRGYTLKDLHTLSKELASELMAAACQYASLRLAGIESRSKFVNKLNSNA